MRIVLIFGNFFHLTFFPKHFSLMKLVPCADDKLSNIVSIAIIYDKNIFCCITWCRFLICTIYRNLKEKFPDFPNYLYQSSLVSFIYDTQTIFLYMLLPHITQLFNLLISHLGGKHKNYLTFIKDWLTVS